MKYRKTTEMPHLKKKVFFCPHHEDIKED